MAGIEPLPGLEPTGVRPLPNATHLSDRVLPAG